MMCFRMNARKGLFVRKFLKAELPDAKDVKVSRRTLKKIEEIQNNAKK